MEVVLNSSQAQQEQFQNKNRDIISSLPSAVICRILSFMPTKDAVGTSILSRKWRYAWIAVPVLDFDITLPFNEGTPKQSEEKCFKQFVNRVLILRCDKIETLRLKVINISERLYDHVNLWICSAVMRNVEELDLDCKSFELPQILFSCKTIKILKLRQHKDKDFKIIESVSLPRLKVLHLLAFSAANLEKILSGSPVLEELVVRRDSSDYLTISLNVVSSSLKRLTIYQNTIRRGVDIRRVVVNAPKLEFFELDDFFSGYFTVMKVSSPIKAVIDVRSSCKNHALRILKRIPNVSDLCLSAYTVQALLRGSDEKFPRFNFLTRLEMTAYENGWFMLPKILKWSPNLEALTLYSYEIDDDGYEFLDDTIFNEEMSVPSCLLSSLESLELKRFEGDEAEMEVLEYFLKNASMLKILKISVTVGVEKEAEILRMLLTFPRASPKCKIVLT
ncbi:putative F-box/FBD/LRR-repeat protein At5g22670 isoform X2 [Mercurialis annua]|uniref:putative F-box/FBD/LRR-repeat protein At5g22670 isoform X2 n=1 Tax=Mercurialis annua TaxID=3986 RepID=UPI00215FF838|nr:putative F-box/FBD/LRR-repeat protein At5g22670 isoform X2 [Mercurialis annua]